MKRCVILLLLLAFSWCATPVIAADSSLSTFWPLFDYRAAPDAEYSSLHLLGPLAKYETKGEETEYALRPLFYRAVDEAGDSSTDILYPLFGYRHEGDATSFHLLHLFNSDFGSRESGSRNRSYLFPFLFYGEEEEGSYAAFFPLGGSLYGWFGKDRISFALFPLYASTEEGTTRVDNFLWPFFARISGEDESGFKVWPLYGRSSKQGVYRKSFFLWPVFYSESLRLDTDNPEEVRAAWPLYVSRESRERSYQALLWPFFSTTEDRVREFRSWDAPWPLVRFTEGERYHGLRLLPLFSDETMDVVRQRWYLWPLYKIEEMNSDLVERRRDRLLFFLYSDTREELLESGDTRRRIDLWPLFGYSSVNGVSHLHVLSLVEPFFPGNQAIERLWSPLWRIYQQKWDEQGNQVISLLWNLYWQERQGERVAWELFPLFEYRRDAGDEKEFNFLKGLISYRADGDGKRLNFLFTPWGVHWGAPRDDQAGEDGK